MQFAAKGLPHGQVVAAASIGRPGNEHNLFAPQRRKTELVPVNVVEYQLGSLGAEKGTPIERLRAYGPQAVRCVVHHFHSEAICRVGQREPIGQGNAHVTFTCAFGFHVPTGTYSKVVGSDIKSINKHSSLLLHGDHGPVALCLCSTP
jgi:hypothetical protein